MACTMPAILDRIETGEPFPGWRLEHRTRSSLSCRRSCATISDAVASFILRLRPPEDEHGHLNGCEAEMPPLPIG
jgi:hypothetical protein